MGSPAMSNDPLAAAGISYGGDGTDPHAPAPGVTVPVGGVVQHMHGASEEAGGFGDEPASSCCSGGGGGMALQAEASGGEEASGPYTGGDFGVGGGEGDASAEALAAAPEPRVARPPPQTPGRAIPTPSKGGAAGFKVVESPARPGGADGAVQPSTPLSSAKTPSRQPEPAPPPPPPGAEGDSSKPALLKHLQASFHRLDPTGIGKAPTIKLVRALRTLLTSQTASLKASRGWANALGQIVDGLEANVEAARIQAEERGGEEGLEGMLTVWEDLLRMAEGVNA